MCLLSRYYLGWLFILDKMYDSINEYNPIEMLIMSTILSESEHILSNIYPCENEKEYQNVRMFRNINDKTMLKEKFYFSYEKNYDDQELFDYCKDKYVLAKLIVYLCHYNSGSTDEKLLDSLYYSHDCYAVGRQILDEIEDAREDYEISKFNIYAYKLIRTYGRIVDEDSIKSELINTAKDYYNKAIRSIENLTDCGWKRFLRISIDKLEK